jgi:uncharacterized protein (DUF58 family)
MLSAEVLAEIKNLEIKTRRLASDVLTGAYSSSFHGQGMEFQEVREYTPGDDVRVIDWNVTARTSIPHVKVYREEREQTIFLLVDVSASVNGGTARSSTLKSSRDLAGVITWVAIQNSDRVGLIQFSDKIEQFIPPKKSRSHAWKIIKDLFERVPSGQSTDIALALDYLRRVQKRRATVFLLSDFWDERYLNALKECSRKHDIVCVSLLDQNDGYLPNAGVIRWRDRETGAELLMNSSDVLVRKAFAAETDRRRSRFEKILRDQGIGYFQMGPNESAVKAFSKYLQSSSKIVLPVKMK